MSTGETRIIATSCIHDCGGRCRLKVHIKDGAVTRIENWGDDEEPWYRGCLRGRAYRQWLYSPDRLKYPLKRVGPRGEGSFQRISWDEALEAVASELRRIIGTYGNQAILFFGFGGGSNGALHGRRAAFRLLNRLGGCTTCWGVYSDHGSITSSLVTYGEMNTGNSREDHLNSRLIILWGWNPADSIWDSGTSLHLVLARERGARVVCIDPRFTNTAAAIAQKWIPIRPGTDAAMLIAMAHVILKNRLEDRKFIETYTLGFERYEDYVLGREDGIEKTPAWAEAITGVPAATIEGLARDYAALKPAALLTGWAPGRTAFGEQFHRAASVLAAMTGNVGISGGNAAGWEGAYPSLWRERHLPTGKNPVDYAAPPRPKALRIREGPNDSSARILSYDMWEAILQGRAGGQPADIKMLWVLGNNPLNQMADTNKGVKALKSLEFVLVHEQRMSATARFADILLPVNTWMERSDYAAPWLGAPYYTFANKAVEPLYESRTDLEVCTDLAARLGLKGFNDKTEEEWLQQFISQMPDIPDYEEFKRKGIHKVQLPEPYIAFKAQIEDPAHNPFPTSSGKIEIYSQTLASMNDPLIPPIPKYLDCAEGWNQPPAQKYPLQLISAHPRPRVHSSLDGLPWLKGVERQALWINPADAGPRGIRDGDPVKVFNDRGTALIPAWVTERIMPGVVHLAEGGNFSPDGQEIDRGGNPNVFTSPRPSPLGSFAANSCLVEVQKT